MVDTSGMGWPRYCPKCGDEVSPNGVCKCGYTRYERYEDEAVSPPPPPTPPPTPRLTPSPPPPSPPPKERTSTGKWVFLSVVVICTFLLLAAIIGALMRSDTGGSDEDDEVTGDPELIVAGFDYRYEFWTDSVEVWGYIVNVGDGPLFIEGDYGVLPIIVHVTVYFEGIPKSHDLTVYASLEPGESVFFQRQLSVPFAYELDVDAVTVTCNSVTWSE